MAEGITLTETEGTGEKKGCEIYNLDIRVEIWKGHCWRSRGANQA